MPKILVIHDQPQSRNLFLRFFAAAGFYTIGADNGLKGIQQAQERLPNLIICGTVLPELDGYDVRLFST